MKNAIIDKAVEDYKAGKISVEECNKILVEQKAGYTFDPKKNTAGGWTEQEMKEGFIPAEKESESLPEYPDMSRNKELAGKTVVCKVRGATYEVTRDEEGYAVVASRVH